MLSAVSGGLHIEGILKTHDWKQWSMRSNAKVMPKVKGERAETSAAGMKEPMGPGRPRKSIEHRKKNNRLIKPSTANALSASECRYLFIYQCFIILMFIF